MHLKTIILTVSGLIGAAVAQLFGGWSDALTVLLICMGIDYITGLIVAGIFHASPKTPNGGLESKAGLKGLLRKFGVLCVVIIAHLMDRLIGTNYIRDAAAIAFCLNEIISILENAGLMGIPIPRAVKKGIEVLRERSEESEGKITFLNPELHKGEDDDGTDQ